MPSPPRHSRRGRPSGTTLFDRTGGWMPHCHDQPLRTTGNEKKSGDPFEFSPETRKRVVTPLNFPDEMIKDKAKGTFMKNYVVEGTAYVDGIQLALAANAIKRAPETRRPREAENPQITLSRHHWNFCQKIADNGISNDPNGDYTANSLAGEDNLNMDRDISGQSHQDLWKNGVYMGDDKFQHTSSDLPEGHFCIDTYEPILNKIAAGFRGLIP